MQKLEISGVHMSIGQDLYKYVTKKIGGLERLMPRHARQSVQVAVKLKGDKASNKKERTCEVIMRLPREMVSVSETTVNIYAAVDSVEQKLRNQLRKYKELHTSPKLHRRLLARLQRSTT